MSVYYIKCAMKRGEKTCIGWERGCVSEHVDSRTFNSTKGRVTISGGGG